MSREELLSRLYAVQAKANEIVDAVTQQTKIAASFRTMEAEKEHVDKGVVNKAKYVFYILLGAYALMRLFISLLIGELLSTLISLAVILVITYVLFELWRGKNSRTVKVFRILFAAYLVYDICHYFSIAVDDLRRGVYWSFLVSIAFFAAALFLIIRLLRYQNGQVDATNKRIVLQNQARVKKNEELQAQYNRLSEKIIVLKKELAELTDNSWYPRDDYFFSIDAINSLVSLVANHQANSMTEAVNRLQDQIHNDRMLQYQQMILEANRQTHINQQAILRQLAFANVMHVQSVALQSKSVRLQSEANSTLQQMSDVQFDIYKEVKEINR